MSGVSTATLVALTATAAVTAGTAVYSANEQSKAASKARQANAQALEKPIAVSPAVDDVKAAQDDARKKARVNLFATEGGVSGQELQPNQVSKRPTLLGN